MSSSALPQARGLSAAVCAGVQDNVIVPFDLVQLDIYPGNEALVGHGFDGAEGKELHTMVAVRYEIVARAGVRGYRLASVPNPSEGFVDGTEFPGGAVGPHGTNPGGAGGI